MFSKLNGFIFAALLATGPVITLAAEVENPARPDLSGTYDTATLTPLERPEWLGKTKHVYPWVAKTLSWIAETGLSWVNESESDPDREATKSTRAVPALNRVFTPFSTGVPDPSGMPVPTSNRVAKRSRPRA